MCKGFCHYSGFCHCFCLTLSTGIIWKITLPPCLFVQPIAVHDFTIYLFDTHTSFYATFKESWCVKHYVQSMGTGNGLPLSESQLIAIEEHGCYQGLLGAGQVAWWQYAKFSSHGITERKRTASYSWSVLLSYKLICMWAFGSPLRIQSKSILPVNWCNF